MVPKDDGSLTSTQQNILRHDLCFALSLLNSLSALKNLELGVDVLEFIWYSSGDTSGFVVPGSWFVRLLSIIRLLKRLSLDHPSLAVLHSVISMGKLRQVELKLKWSNFVFDSYTRADLKFPPEWTQTVKEEMEELVEKLLQRRRRPM